MELLTIIMASVSCGAFCLVMLTLFMVLHRNTLCCSFFQRFDNLWEEAVQHSVHSLISHVSYGFPIIPGPSGPQPPSGVFVVGKPSQYHLSGPYPHLPSYDTVRRDDRRTLSLFNQTSAPGPLSPPPPSYEESVRLSLDMPTVEMWPIDTEHQPRNHPENHSGDHPQNHSENQHSQQ